MCRKYLDVERDGRTTRGGAVAGARERERETGGKIVRECRGMPLRRGRGERKDRRKQAAIVSDDSLVATHAIAALARLHPNHPLSVFLSFALSALLTTVRVPVPSQSARPAD